MNKHTRLAAGILVLVLVILIAATISFSANVSEMKSYRGTTTFPACRMRQEIRFSNRSGNNSTW